MSYPYLNNLDFLASLAEERVKEHYIKIIVLDWNEKEVAEVQSTINSGSININGDSSLRRSGSLSTNLDPAIYDVDDVNSLFSLNKKIKIEKGLKNPSSTLYQDYPVIWFPLGIYVITGLSVNYQTNGSIQLNISIQDKMCLLNGTVAGSLPAAMNVDTITTIDEITGEAITKKATIKQIIRELVNHWGGEQLGNILITGIPDNVLSVREWISSLPLLIDISTNEIFKNTAELPNMVIPEQKTLMEKILAASDPSTCEIPDGGWQLKDEYSGLYYLYNKGEICGREWVPFCYTGSDKGLIANAGASISSVLDTIVNYLGNVEYFYNVDGQFVFREKPNNLNKTRANDILKVTAGEVTYDDIASEAASATKFVFNDTMLISAITKAPNILNVKNDFVVIGQRTIDKQKFVITYQTCIDDTPQVPDKDDTFVVCYYYDTSDKLVKAAVPQDYSYTAMETMSNPAAGVFYYCSFIDGDTSTSTRFDNAQEGMYYWSNNKFNLYYEDKEQTIVSKKTNTVLYKEMQWQTYQYYKDMQQEALGLATSYYYARLKNEWPRVFDLKKNQYYDAIQKDSYNADFYLEIIDSNTEVGRQYSIPKISRRTYVYNNTKINCLFEPAEQGEYVFILDTANVEQIETEVRRQNSNYNFITVTEDWLNKNTQQKTYWLSAYSVMRDLLYQYTHYNETIQLTTIPLYFLEANCQIELGLTNEKLSGKYWVKSVSVPLDSNGTMNISTTKLLKKF